MRRLMHASQELEIDRVPPPTGSCTVVRRVVAVWDKERAAIVECEDEVSDGDGRLARAVSQWWIEGAGGFGGARRAVARRREPGLPDREADAVERWRTSTEQAALYRLSGDRNPVHVDPALARAAGQPRPLLHGLCTFGWLGSVLDRAAGPGLRLRSLAGRFPAPVFPGNELVVEAWLNRS